MSVPDLSWLFWLFVLAQFFVPLYQKQMLEHHAEPDAERIATKLSSGEWTHDYALDPEELRALGVAVQEEMPREVYDLMDLFPQTSQRRPGVEFIPLPYAPAMPAVPRKTGPG